MERACPRGPVMSLSLTGWEESEGSREGTLHPCLMRREKQAGENPQNSLSCSRNWTGNAHSLPKRPFGWKNTHWKTLLLHKYSKNCINQKKILQSLGRKSFCLFCGLSGCMSFAFLNCGQRSVHWVFGAEGALCSEKKRSWCFFLPVLNELKL